MKIILIILAVVVLAIIGFAAWFLWVTKNKGMG